MFKAIKNAIGDAAPVLATALGGPLAGAAIATIGSALGLGETSRPDQVLAALKEMNPDQEFALMKANNDFYIQYCDQLNTALKTITVDKQSARNDQSKATNSMRKQALWIVSTLVVVSTAGLIYLCKIEAIDATEAAILGGANGALISKLSTIIDFLFGTGVEYVKDLFKRKDDQDAA